VVTNRKIYKIRLLIYNMENQKLNELEKEKICFHKKIFEETTQVGGIRKESMYKNNSSVQCGQCDGTQKDAERLNCGFYISLETEEKYHQREKKHLW
jgi:hypothetical protein